MKSAPPQAAWKAGRWPYRPRPLPDELLSSYVTRCAQALYVKPITLLNASLGSRQSLFSQDIDNYANELIVDRIASACLLDAAVVRGMTLAAYEGLLQPDYFPNGRKVWIMPVSISATNRLRGGLQFCPECLRTDTIPYFRRRWRLALSTCCTKHKISLHDRCPDCEAPIHIHQSFSMRYCYLCSYDLADAASVTPYEHVFRQQAEFEHALAEGWASLNGRPLYSHLYFAVVRRVAGLLSSGKRSHRLRAALVKRYGGSDGHFDRGGARQPMEYLCVLERVRLLDLVARTMSDFPHRFVEICKASRHSRSYIIKDMPYVPFAFDLVLRTSLDKSPYYPTEIEVDAAARWLRRAHGKAQYRRLKEIFGESRGLLYKYLDYERRPATPSWRRAAALKQRRRTTKNRIDPAAH
jgi:hypothetical protein